MTVADTLRKEIKKQLDKADESSLRRVSAILAIDQQNSEWWKDKDFVKELDRRYEALEAGKDKGVTKEQLKIAIEKHKQKKYGK